MANRKQAPTQARPGALTFDAAWAAFVRHYKAEHASPRTLKNYLAATHQLRDFLVSRGLPTEPEMTQREYVQDFIAHLLATRSASTANTRYWGLRAFFGWLVNEEEIEASPLARVKAPAMDDRPPDMLTDEQVAALLAACSGRTFEVAGTRPSYALHTTRERASVRLRA